MPAQSAPVNATSGQVKQDSLYEHLFMLPFWTVFLDPLPVIVFSAMLGVPDICLNHGVWVFCKSGVLVRNTLRVVKETPSFTLHLQIKQAQ